MTTLNDNEKALVKRLAADDKSTIEEAKAIYYAHLKEYIDGGRKSLEMNFLSEVFNVCPDLALRAMYRKKILATEVKAPSAIKLTPAQLTLLKERSGGFINSYKPGLKLIELGLIKATGDTYYKWKINMNGESYLESLKKS